ncbi:MAG: XRE family transcriptional regulator [Acidobacteriaceae bacterium]|nr:XRE family transcriptional regulator [Acidobacteriaceae bacterium]
MADEIYATVFDAICDTAAEAANLKVRAEIMLNIRELVKRWKVTEAEAAKRLGLTRPRLNDLMRGKINKFSLDALVNIATAAGYLLQINMKKAA